MRSVIVTAVLGVALAIGSALAPAQAEYPEKPVTFIVPFPPGDLEDVLTRLIADNFQAKYGVAAAVVNKPGGGGGPFPGAVEVAKAPPDGSVIGSFVISVPIIGPKLGIPELNPNPFDPLGIFLTYPFVLASSKDAPFKDIDGLIAYAKSNDVALGHFGAVLVPTKVSFALAKKKDFTWASEAAYDMLDCNTLASGDVDVINTTLQLILPCLDKLNILASITSKRISRTPDAPTVAEIEPSLDIALWNGLFVHKDTPADIRRKIVAVARETVLGARAQEVANNTGALVYWMDAAESASRIDKDAVSIANIGKLLGN